MTCFRLDPDRRYARCHEAALTRDCSMLLAVVIFMCLLRVPSCSFERSCGRKKEPILITCFTNLGLYTRDSLEYFHQHKSALPLGFHVFQLTSRVFLDVAVKNNIKHYSRQVNVLG